MVRGLQGSRGWRNRHQGARHPLFLGAPCSPRDKKTAWVAAASVSPDQPSQGDGPAGCRVPNCLQPSPNFLKVDNGVSRGRSHPYLGIDPRGTAEPFPSPATSPRGRLVTAHPEVAPPPI